MDMPIPDATGPVATAQRELSALGTRVTVATTFKDSIDGAELMLREELAALDQACSRFRSDSEISQALQRGGYPVLVGRLLSDVIDAALTVASDTDGAVDPTVGTAINVLGYDRDFGEIASSNDSLLRRPRPAPGWHCIELDRDNRVLRIPEGVVLDLGATAKAFAADRAAERIALATGAGVLVNLGGDIALAGVVPAGGWPIGLALDCSTPPEGADAVVAIHSGGLASSGTAVRTWRRGGRQLHHIIDPKTGDSAATCWRLASVAAPTCVEANAMSTAAIVWSDDAPARLATKGVPCRLVRNDGFVLTLGGWPPDGDAPSSPPATAA